MAVVGSGYAVLQSGKLFLKGSVAWLIWAAVHRNGNTAQNDSGALLSPRSIGWGIRRNHGYRIGQESFSPFAEEHVFS
jgi:hypothetical protein